MGGSDELGAAIATCESVLGKHDVEVVDIRLLGSGKGRILRVTLDSLPTSAHPLGIEEISEISEELSRALDIDDPFEGPYTLEVESAGLERPLRKPSDYERFLGRTAKVKVSQPIEGSKVFEGEISGVSDEAFVLRAESGVVEIPFSSVKKANLAVDWEAELKDSVGSGGE